MHERPLERMTLRERLTHAEKCARDLIEHIHSNVLPRHEDFRDLSRPTRRRSHYPTLLALSNSLKKLQQVVDEALALADYLHVNLDYIHNHAVHERGNRR